MIVCVGRTQVDLIHSQASRQIWVGIGVHYTPDMEPKEGLLGASQRPEKTPCVRPSVARTGARGRGDQSDPSVEIARLRADGQLDLQGEEGRLRLALEEVIFDGSVG